MRRNDEARMAKPDGMTKSENPRNYFEEAFWDGGATSVIREEPGEKRVYDLEDRTARFGEAIIDFAKTIPQSAVTSRIISQLVGAGTSVGANYLEADDAVSKKEFLKYIGTCRKEARETKHFLRMIVRAVAGTQSRSSKALDGSEGTEPDLLQDLEEQVRKPETTMKPKAQKTCADFLSFELRISFELRHSDFVIVNHANAR